MFLNLFHFRKKDLASSDLPFNSFKEFIGLTKKQLKEKVGFSYNDIHSNVWMYHLYPDVKITKPNYLYLIFKDGVVCKYYLTRFKTSKFYKLYDSHLNTEPSHD